MPASTSRPAKKRDGRGIETETKVPAQAQSARSRSRSTGVGALWAWVSDLATNPRHSRWLIPLLILFDAAVCVAVIAKVPYTEIDWKTYMEHIRLVFDKGERDYGAITGPTGPLVYPAVHVYLYGILSRLTSSGRDIVLAQYLFAGLYLIGLTLALKIYQTARAPPYLLPFLVLSRRLHSVFMLRLFNDGFVAVFILGAVLAYQRQRHSLGTIILTLAIGVKMSALLVVPAVVSVLVTTLGFYRTVTQGLMMCYLHAILAYPFITVSTKSYFSRAFDLSRVFEYKWTVNWRFLSEQTFLDTRFALSLLAVHFVLLALFGLTRWIRDPFNGALAVLPDQAIETENLPQSRKVSSIGAVRYVVFDSTYATDGVLGRIQATASNVARARAYISVPTAIFAANAVGMVAARSLHYQFYAWLYWTTPFLLWRGVSALPVPVTAWPVRFGIVAAVVAAQEWAWNVFPSTPVSSGVVVAALAVQVFAGWIGQAGDFTKEVLDEEAKKTN